VFALFQTAYNYNNYIYIILNNQIANQLLELHKIQKGFLTVFDLLVFITACNTHKETASSKAEPSVQKSPFSLSVVPETSYGEHFGSSIEMAHDKAHAFYAVLTNVSSEPQAVWEYWNSWGYQTISFELATVDGKKVLVSRGQEDFTRNFPSTFLIEPGEHQVYAVRLDECWTTHPSLPKTAETAITLKAIYEVAPTPESAQYRVWTGRVESRNYNFNLRQL
jgi:hypothetical protein